jgi:hypothetical protein
VVPDEEVFYLVAFLRNVLPSGPGLESMLDENKHMFDPHAILAPGQNMFRRNQNPPGLDQLLLLPSDSASS